MQLKKYELLVNLVVERSIQVRSKGRLAVTKVIKKTVFNERFLKVIESLSPRETINSKDGVMSITSSP
jgi:hypothetical protein